MFGKARTLLKTVLSTCVQLRRAVVGDICTQTIQLSISISQGSPVLWDDMQVHATSHVVPLLGVWAKAPVTLGT